MHQEAFEGVKNLIEKHESYGPYRLALDIGGQDVNSTSQGIHPHGLLNVEKWDVLDIYPGSGVTIVADGTTWRKPVEHPGYDLVLSTETLEHVKNWKGILTTASEALVSGGTFLGSWASTGRPPHSAEGHPDPFILGEHYANVSPEETEIFLRESNIFSVWELVFNDEHGDCYMWATK